MNNKTCGQCKHCKDSKSMGMCEQQKLCLCPEELPACSKFDPKVVTNGDKIRAMSNEELAEKFGCPCPCPPLPKKHCSGIDNEECTECWLNWLNAPAESEGNNG